MRSLPLVREFMTTKVRSLSPDKDILLAVDFLLKHKISGAPVVEKKNRLVGVISEKDCLRLLAHGVDGLAPEGTVADFMTKDVETVGPDMDIYYVAGLFLKKNYRRFPVLEDGELVGVISRHDVLRAIEWVQRLTPPGGFRVGPLR